MRSNLAKEEGVQGEEKTGLGGCRCLLKGRNRAGIRGRGVEQWGGGVGQSGAAPRGEEVGEGLGPTDR
jgi:hypothetical protein